MRDRGVNRRTLHHKLVCACDERQPIVMVEGLRDILPECVSSTTGRYPPSATIVGVRPEEVAHGPLVRHFLHTVDGSDVVEGVDRGREASVETEYLSCSVSGLWVRRQITRWLGHAFFVWGWDGRRSKETKEANTYLIFDQCGQRKVVE